MKFALLLLIVSSCGVKNESGTTIINPDTACVDGNIYFYNYGNQYGGGYMSPKFDDNMKLIKCSMEEAVEDGN